MRHAARRVGARINSGYHTPPGPTSSEPYAGLPGPFSPGRGEQACRSPGSARSNSSLAGAICRRHDHRLSQDRVRSHAVPDLPGLYSSTTWPARLPATSALRNMRSNGGCTAFSSWNATIRPHHRLGDRGRPGLHGVGHDPDAVTHQDRMEGVADPHPRRLAREAVHDPDARRQQESSERLPRRGIVDAAVEPEELDGVAGEMIGPRRRWGRRRGRTGRCSDP